MSLFFGASASDKVSVPNDTELADLTTFSVLAWVHLLGSFPAGNAMVFSKDYASGEAKSLYVTSTGALASKVERATTDSTNISAAAALDKLRWQFVAMTYDTTDGIKLFKGSDINPAYLLTPASSALGSGTVQVDAAYPLLWGNNGAADSVFKGLIGAVGYFNRVLTASEILEQSVLMKRNRSCVVFQHLGDDFTNNTQIDKTIYRNNGTITGSLNKEPSPKYTRICPQGL